MNILIKPIITFFIPAVIGCELSKLPDIPKLEENTKEISIVEQCGDFYEAIQKMQEQLLENLKSLNKTIVEVEVEE